MTNTKSDGREIKLSICMSTRNRGRFIGMTLSRLLSQITHNCEVVVVDGASTDDTERVVGEIVRKHSNVRYYKQENNGGFDRDFDRAVGLAAGEYCWLLPDDDILKPGAIDRILCAIEKGYFLVLLNIELRDATMSRVLMNSMINLKDDRIFKRTEMDDLFKECCGLLSYVGSFVVRREVWLSRDRVKYYGSDFIHVGTLFQAPLPGDALVIVTPSVSVRMGNQLWHSRAFEVLLVHWPWLISTLALSSSTKASAAEIHINKRKHVSELLLYRAVDAYSVAEYRRYVRPQLSSLVNRILPFLVAITPPVITNTFCILKCLALRQALDLEVLRRSSACCRLWKLAEYYPAPGEFLD